MGRKNVPAPAGDVFWSSKVPISEDKWVGRTSPLRPGTFLVCFQKCQSQGVNGPEKRLRSGRGRFLVFKSANFRGYVGRKNAPAPTGDVFWCSKVPISEGTWAGRTSPLR